MKVLLSGVNDLEAISNWFWVMKSYKTLRVNHYKSGRIHELIFPWMFEANWITLNLNFYEKNENVRMEWEPRTLQSRTFQQHFRNVTQKIRICVYCISIRTICVAWLRGCGYMISTFICRLVRFVSALFPAGQWTVPQFSQISWKKRVEIGGDDDNHWFIDLHITTSTYYCIVSNNSNSNEL